MRREIKFRGLRDYDGKWLCGNLVIDKHGQSHIIPFDYFDEDGHHLIYDDNTDEPVFIRDETIGQSTGQKDKNVQEIYENDIITSKGYVGVVKFGDYISPHCKEENLGFYIDWLRRKANLRPDILFWVNEREIEVIGNIYENPELLEAVNDG